MKVDVQTKVLDYFRAHPGQQPSKESLKAARRAGEMKQAKPAASKQQVVLNEAPRPSSRNELAFIASADNEPFDEWEDAKQQKAVAWLQRTQREAATEGIEERAGKHCVGSLGLSASHLDGGRCDASLTLYTQLEEIRRKKRNTGCLITTKFFG
jgi:hypothetical protein